MKKKSPRLHCEHRRRNMFNIKIKHFWWRCMLMSLHCFGCSVQTERVLQQLARGRPGRKAGSVWLIVSWSPTKATLIATEQKLILESSVKTAAGQQQAGGVETWNDKDAFVMKNSEDVPAAFTRQHHKHFCSYDQNSSTGRHDDITRHFSPFSSQAAKQISRWRGSRCAVIKSWVEEDEDLLRKHDFFFFSSNFSLLLIYRCAHPSRQPTSRGQKLLREKKASDVGIISAFHATRSIQTVALPLPLLVTTTDCAGLAPPLARRPGLMTAPGCRMRSNILLLLHEKSLIPFSDAGNLPWNAHFLRSKHAFLRLLNGESAHTGGANPSLRRRWIHQMRRIGRRSEENYSHQRRRSH